MRPITVEDRMMVDFVLSITLVFGLLAGMGIIYHVIKKIFFGEGEEEEGD